MPPQSFANALLSWPMPSLPTSPRQTPPSQEELRCVIRWFGAVHPCLQKTLCLPFAQPEAVLPTGLPEAESGARLSVTNRERKW